MKLATIAISIVLLGYQGQALAQSQQDREFVEFCERDATMSGEILRAAAVCSFPEAERKAVSSEFSQSSVECKQAIGRIRYDELHRLGAAKLDDSISTQGKQKICSAHLEAVQDIFMPTDSQSDNQLSPADGERPSFCEDRLSVHGLLTAAQVECGFNKYSNDLVQTAKICTAQIGEEKSAEIIKFGLREFYRNVDDMGKSTLCADLVKSFPQFIGK